MTQEEKYEVMNIKLDNIAEDVKELKELAKKTNGRVTTIELWKARVEGVSMSAKFVWPTISAVVVSVVAFALLYAFGPSKNTEIKQETDTSSVGKVHHKRQGKRGVAGKHSGSVKIVSTPKGTLAVVKAPSDSQQPSGGGQIGPHQPKHSEPKPTNPESPGNPNPQPEGGSGSAQPEPNAETDRPTETPPLGQTLTPVTESVGDTVEGVTGKVLPGD